MPKISIIIPTLNEAGNISSLTERIFSVLESESITGEIIVVDDGSTDGTREEAAQLEKRYPLRLKCRDNKRGLASAVVEGARLARYETVVVMDGDSSHPPEMIPRLILPLHTENRDVVIGSRYTTGGKTPGWPLSRKIASKLASFPAQHLTGTDDPLSGFFAVSRDTLRGVNPDVQGYKICLEVLMGQDKDLDVKEIPISFSDRARGNSKMTRSIVQSYFRQLADLCGIAPPDGFRSLFLPLLFAGILSDAAIYWICASLETAPLWRHAVPFIGSVVAILLTLRLLNRKKTTALLPGHRFLPILSLFLIWFLRIGVFAFTETVPPGQSLPVLPVLAEILLSAAALSYVLSMNALAEGQAKISRHVGFRLVLLSLIGVSFALRFLYAGSFELLKEEAYYWMYAQHLDIGYLDHPPMVAVLISISTFLLGNSEFAVRIGALFCWAAAVWFVYQFTRDIRTELRSELRNKIRSRDTALQAAAIMAVVPGFFTFGLFLTPDPPLIACWAGTLFFLRRALVDHGAINWLGVGICLGLGMISKYTIALLGPAILVYLIIDKSSRHLFLKPYPYGAALLALLIFSPVILWNFQHDWASFLFQTQNRLEASSEFSTHEMLLFIIILLGPVGFAAALVFLLRGKRILTTGVTTNRNYLFAFTLTVVPLLIFFYFSLSKEIKFNWTCPVWLAALPFIAMTLSAAPGFLKENGQRWFLRSWQATILILLFAYATLLQFLAIGIPGVPYSGGGPLWTWNIYARQLDELSHAIELQTGKRPVLVGMDQYKTASGVTFYRTRNHEQNNDHGSREPLYETVGRNIAGPRSAVMYEFWFGRSDYEERPLILVSPSRSDLNDHWIAKNAEHFGDIEILQTTRNGEKSEPLYYRRPHAVDQEGITISNDQ